MAVHENGHETLEAFFPYYDQLYPFPVYLSLEAQTPSLLIKKKNPKTKNHCLILKFPLELVSLIIFSPPKTWERR